jgi:two-component system, NtrC family, nitrogen regulation sensor histidine kinase NtrY
MIYIIKNYKWVIASSLICLVFGILTFLTFTNQSFITLKNLNLQILLIVDLILLLIFFILIIYKIYEIRKSTKQKKIGYETNLRYIFLFSVTTLLPAVLIAFFSLILFNVGLQKYFDKKIKSVVNNSSEIAKNYVEQTRNSIEADISLVLLDLNNKSDLFYERPKQFLNLLTSQRLLRKLDEIHLVDSSGNLIMSNIIDPTINYIPPTEEAFNSSLTGKPVRIIDTISNRTSALIKLDNFIDTYLYIVRFMDPNVINYLNQTGEAVSFYYSVQESKTGIKITFVVIYLLIVTLFLFLAIIISINLASKLSVPIINLIRASEKISSGDLSAKVQIINTDTGIKILNQNFNLMIDKLKKQQDKLLLSERHMAWESVARKLAHEIKNPLTPIQLSIDRIREKYVPQIKDENENFSEYLNTVTKQIKDIESLLNEFSDFARMPKPVFKKINLNKLVLRSLNLYKISEKNIIFNFLEKNQIIEIDGDEEQLNRVFINLFKNSIESINEKKIKNADFKGKIEVEILKDSDYIYLIIIDNGIGFDQIDKAKMITPYFTTKKKGTGLGLAIVTKVINDHNGSILFESINSGAKITITLTKKND